MDKNQTYQLLVKQVESLIEGEHNPTGQLANAAALLHETMRWWWTGFYLVDGENLRLGPFQGPVACYNIKRRRGVCGTAWAENRTIVVPDVEQFPGHIACSSQSRSEIVVPLRDNEGNVIGVLDIDSKELATFDDVDARWLEEIARVITLHTFPASNSVNPAQTV
ncbi:MAG: GAF domain-containing protein [Muribaculaceae bacterium]|nr:GAF domain-containing protein [Muribaculaceae bacterium]